MTLVQQELKRRYSKGYVDITFEGTEGDETQQLELAKVSNLTREQLKFSFQYFQIISGEFILPEGFIAENITVSAILTKSRWQKYAKKEQNMPWQVSE